jgi:hypothetical protein
MNVLGLISRVIGIETLRLTPPTSHLISISHLFTFFSYSLCQSHLTLTLSSSIYIFRFGPQYDWAGTEHGIYKILTLNKPYINRG